jgi:parallel beta-helix repeat protein
MGKSHKFNKNFIIGLSILFVALVIISENITINSSSDLMSDNIDNDMNFGDHKDFLNDLKNLKTSGYWSNFTYIHITDLNWSTAAGYEWCTGDGSYGNPYVIENMTIDASSAPISSGIYIENSTNVYFMISNCTITGASYAGIWLERTHNGTLSKNNCSNNNLGISIRGDNSPDIRSSNNTIVNNTLSWNNQGFQCWRANNNKITNNTMNNNDIYGISIAGYAVNNNFTNNIIRDDSAVSPRVGTAIAFYNADGNNVRNNTIINCESYGIRLQFSSYGNNIENNTIINCLSDGIYLYDNNDNNIIHNNTIINARYFGIHLRRDAGSTVIKDNEMINCSIVLDPTTYGFSLSDLQSNTIAVNNTVNGKAVYCYVDETGLGDSNFTTYGDIGQIIMINCNDSDISDLSILHPNPISLYYCNNNTIDNNTLGLAGYGFSGILLSNSSLNNITANTVSGGESYGLFLIESSDDNIIYGNILNSGGSAYDDQGTNNQFDWNVLNGVLSENPTIDEIGAGNFTWIEAESLLAWVTGSGSWSEPYLISGLQIDVSASTSGDGSGIQISNSHEVNFTIRDCTITNANIGSVSESVSNYSEFVGGIKLINCSKGTIDNNTCDGGLNACGILVVNGSYNISIINNLAFDNEKHGIMVVNNSYDIYIDNNTAHSNYNTYSRGIYILKDCYNITISNNTMSDNEYNGIFLVTDCHDNWIVNNICNDTSFGNEQDEGIFIGWGCHNNTIEFNYVCDNDVVGIRLAENSDDNIILNNTILEVAGVSGVQDRGIYMYTGCNGNQIINNTIKGHGLNGIDISDNCNNNTIHNNTVSDNEWHGIFLDNCDNNNITYNIVNDNGASGSYDGIRLNNDCDWNRIIHNNCTGNTYNGIGLYDTSDDNLVANNTIHLSGTEGIGVNNCDRNNYTGNAISNSTNY